MTSVDEYRAARQMQNARYENETGLPIGDTHRQEYRDWFGTGEHSATTTEPRVTYKTWLQQHRAEQPPADLTTKGEAWRMTTKQLAILAQAGDWVAADEIVRRAIKNARINA